MKTHVLNLEDFKNTESHYVLASSSVEGKRLAIVTVINEHLQSNTYYEVTVKGESVLSNALLIDAVKKYNSITK